MKYFYQTFLTLCISLLGELQLVHAQGCVAVRPCSPTGYIASVDPGLLYMYKNLNFVLTAPIALYRNRIKSVYDLADPAGERHGDAAFADYLLNFTVAYSFRKKSHQPMKNIFQQVDDGADIH